MKIKLTNEGIVLIAENAIDDDACKNLFKMGLPLRGKACFRNKEGHQELLLQNGLLPFNQITKVKTVFEK